MRDVKQQYQFGMDAIDEWGWRLHEGETVHLADQSSIKTDSASFNQIAVSAYLAPMNPYQIDMQVHEYELPVPENCRPCQGSINGCGRILAAERLAPPL
jgi:hypothetical protein